MLITISMLSFSVTYSVNECLSFFIQKLFYFLFGIYPAASRRISIFCRPGHANTSRTIAVVVDKAITSTVSYSETIGAVREPFPDWRDCPVPQIFPLILLDCLA